MAKKGDKRGSGKGSRGSAKLGGSRSAGDRLQDPFGVDGLVRAALSGARELLAIDDPLEAEDWASGVLGAFYKLPVPFDVRERRERSLGPALVQGAERKRNATGLAVLYALAGVTGDELGAREAAARMAARGVPRPRWADVIGTPDYVGGYSVSDPFGDQIGYYLIFRYTDRRPHMMMALYDENLGGIIKDAFIAGLREDVDPRTVLGIDPDVTVQDADPAEAAARIGRAIATGDLFVDNAWTTEFKESRALLLARLRLLPVAEPPQADGAPRRRCQGGADPGVPRLGPRPSARGDAPHRRSLPHRPLRLRRRRPAVLEPDRGRALHARLPATQGQPEPRGDGSAPAGAHRVGALRPHQARPRRAFHRRDRGGRAELHGGVPGGRERQRQLRPGQGDGEWRGLSQRSRQHESARPGGGRDVLHLGLVPERRGSGGRGPGRPEGTLMEGDLPPIQAAVVAMHTALYQDHPDVGSVIHAHQPYATVFAVANREIGCWTEAMAMFGLADGVPVAAYGPRGSERAVASIRAAVRPGVPAVLWANHGLLVFPRSPDLDVLVGGVVEEAARATA